MPKYLVQVNYTPEGARGLHHDGGTKRRSAAQHAAESMGGKLIDFFFCFGASDVVCIADMPDTVTAAALAVVVSSSGAAETVTTPLVTCEEMDAACKKVVDYKAPGK
jgi:uncharacterized protein with GYD domain